MKRCVISIIGCLAMSLVALPARASETSPEDLATKLIAVSGFVGNNCPGMQPNGLMLNAAMSAIGVDPDKIVSNQGRLMQGALIIGALSKNTKASCEQAWELFGANGTSLPGLFDRN